MKALTAVIVSNMKYFTNYNMILALAKVLSRHLKIIQIVVEQSVWLIAEGFSYKIRQFVSVLAGSWDAHCSGPVVVEMG